MRDVIVIPTYNEKRNIEILIPKIFEMYPDVTIMVVDDLSPDGTQDAVRAMMDMYPQLRLYAHNQKSGFARAYIDAFRKVLDEMLDVRSITMMDADHSHDPVHLKELWKQIATNDLVIGSRYIRGGGIDGWEWWRAMLSSGGNVYLRTISRLPIRDITGGFNCLRADMLRKLRIDEADARGYAFQFLLKYLFLQNGARVTEVPITFRQRFEGESKLTHHIITEALVLPWKITFRKK